MSAKIFITDSFTGKPRESYSGLRMMTFEPERLNSGEIMRLMFETDTANAANVGGTSSLFPSDVMKVPLIESFPPIAPTP